MFKDFQINIFNMKYKDDADNSIQDMWRRTSVAVANAESNAYDQSVAEHLFYEIQEDFKFIAGGRVNNGAGTRNNYLINCFVLPIEDSLDEIFETIKKSAQIFKKNGGVGYSLHKLRPKNAPLSNGGSSSGPISFLKAFDAAGDVIRSGGYARRAAQIAVLPIDSPDIFDFIQAKRKEGELTQFNLSVGITDEFINAVENDLDFDLKFEGKIYQTVKAKDLFEVLVESAWKFNDPGILYLDEVNRYNNMSYKYNLHAVNPCGKLNYCFY